MRRPRPSSQPGPTARAAPAGGARLGRLAADARGAVYVEFLGAFMPVFVFFLCLLQLALVFSHKLLVEHAAVQSARAAAVIFADEPGPYGDRGGDPNTLSSGRRQAVRDAALVSLAPLILDGSISRVHVVIPRDDDALGADQPEGAKLAPMTDAGTRMMRVRVEADVVCKIAIANVIACTAAPGGARRVTLASAEAVFPYQGASYAYE